DQGLGSEAFEIVELQEDAGFAMFEQLLELGHDLLVVAMLEQTRNADGGDTRLRVVEGNHWIPPGLGSSRLPSRLAVFVPNELHGKPRSNPQIFRRAPQNATLLSKAPRALHALGCQRASHGILSRMGQLKDDLASDGAERLETHTAWVFLRADRAFKVKKPVNFGFLDFTSLDKRRVACEAEVQLNARLAPDVYLGVVPIHRDASGRHHVRGSGELVDYAVEMKRLS